jgi:hypothetical protein
MERWIPIIFILILGGTYGFGHHNGWADRDVEMQAEIATKNEAAREAEKKLSADLNQTSIALQEANDAITQKQTALDRAIAAGRVRLPSSCVQASGSSSTPPVGGNAATSESDRETLRLIAEIVAQGDRNTEQLNACIAAYNQVMEAVNGQR